MDELTILDIINEDGKPEKICVILYFNLEDDDKDYIIYKCENGNEFFASEIEELDNEINLKEIKDKDAINSINELIKEIEKK